jgi:hypothetical protein
MAGVPLGAEQLVGPLYCFLVVVDLSFVNGSAEILAYCLVLILGTTILGAGLRPQP